MSNILEISKQSNADDAGGFNILFQPTEDNPKGLMWYVWNELQVYATWGVKLPNTAERLKLELKISDPASLSFFTTMLEGYTHINSSSSKFINSTFPRVVGLGNKVHSFAKDSGGDDEAGIFSAVISMIKEKNFSDAATMLKDLQEQAKSNEENAIKVIEELSKYKTELEKAEADLKLVKDRIDSDEATSQATIDRLMGDDKSAGELKKIQEKIALEMAEYKHDVVVATTTLTYGWLPGFGNIAAIIVAAVFGDAARNLLNDIERLQTELANKEKEVKLALDVRQVQQVAEGGVTTALTKTNHALRMLGLLQGGWNKIAAGLGDICEEAEKMTKDDGNPKSLAVVLEYARLARKNWGNLIVPLDELLADPYIKTKREDYTVKSLKQDVNSILDKRAAA